MKPGMVYLVGAGPGGPGLITLRGLECIERADVVIYDRLIDERLLEHCKPAAELIDVGKSATSHTMEQDEINQLLISKAKQGKAVVRLKGGDPFVLGRGGEEADALSSNDVPFEVVPGVSSAVAVPAYAGIPVTHRHVASSFAVVTGHEDPLKDTSSVNWKKLAAAADTLICLMGMGNLSHIVDELIAGGRAPDTPVALIRYGTTPAQETITGTLSTIVEEADKADFKPPVVIVVGDVVVLRDRLSWFEKRPLFGKRILVTRSRSQAGKLSRLLTERGATTIELPTVEIRDVSDTTELDQAVRHLHDYHWVLFTSVNGVEALWNRLSALRLDARWFRDVRIGAIGPATAEALASRGLNADFVPAEHTSEAAASGLGEIGVSGQRILLPRADIAPKDLCERLIELGAKPHEVVAYITKTPSEISLNAREILDSGNIDIATFTSSSTVTNLLSLLDEEPHVLDGIVVACIGPVTAATAKAAGLNTDIIAEEYTIPGLVEAIERYYEKGKA